MTVDILCKVVDNYGDIGVVYRLAKSLAAAAPELGLRILVDDLGSFQALVPSLDPALPRQRLGSWEILRWDSPREAFAPESEGGPPCMVLECFACGRPPGFEEALFDPGRVDIRHIVNLEHLTAEAWARDFHLLPSATRSALVKKSFFMPGFEAGTGGLLIDPPFRKAQEAWKAAREASPLAARRILLDRLGGELRGLEGRPELGARLWLPVFSYEQDYRGIVAELAIADRTTALLALVAAGRSAPSFIEAWEKAARPFPILVLPFLPQELWDEVLLAADLSIVRGEESLARAVLAGRPFLWQAYLQAERHQLVKVRALLELLRPRFEAPAFAALEAAWLAFNDRETEGLPLRDPIPLAPFLAALPALEPGFADFAAQVAALGDLGRGLAAYLRRLSAET